MSIKYAQFRAQCSYFCRAHGKKPTKTQVFSTTQRLLRDLHNLERQDTESVQNFLQRHKKIIEEGEREGRAMRKANAEKQRAINEQNRIANEQARATKTQEPTPIDKTEPNWLASGDFLKSYEWRRLRMEVLKRDGRICACCGATPTKGTHVQVDHIKPRRHFPELALDANNLQVLCDACNHGKGNWDHTNWSDAQPNHRTHARLTMQAALTVEQSINTWLELLTSDENATTLETLITEDQCNQLAPAAALVAKIASLHAHSIKENL